MQTPQRVIIVNEDDTRKNEVYTQGDVDAAPSGLGMFACDPTTTMRILRSDDAGNLNINIAKGAGIVMSNYDYISRGWVAGTFTETWTFKTGGAGGSTVATITVVYDDVNMSNIVSVTKT